jgi:hypothetical protein
MSTLNSATNIVDSLILNPKSDFGFKDMEPGKIYYIVGKSLKISSEHFSEPYKKFHKFLEAGNYCLSFFSSFDSVTDVTGESRLHPMLFKLYIDSNNEWMLDVRIFTSQKIVDNCNKYKWTTFISDFYLNGKEAKAFVNQEEVGQYIRNIGFRIRLNKDLTVLENIYQITGSTINFLDMTNFNNIFSIKYFQYKSFGNYLINFVEPKLKDQPFFKIIEIDGKLNFFIENTDKISLEYKCCKSGNSAYLKKLKK